MVAESSATSQCPAPVPGGTTSFRGEPEELVTVTVAGSLELVDASSLLTLTTTTGAEGEVVVTAVGDIDLSSAPAFDACLADALDVPGCRTLIVDLSGVLFLGARGGGSLEEVREQAERCHMRFAVVADTRNVLRALRSTAANGVAVFPTVSAARADAEVRS